MAQLRFTGRVASGQDLLDTGIRALAVADLPGGPVVYAVTGPGGGIAGFALAGGGPARLAAAAAFDGALAAMAAPQLAAMTVDGAPALALAGATGPLLARAALGAAGEISLPGLVPGPALMPVSGVSALAAMPGAAGQERLALAAPGALQLLARDAAGGGFAPAAALADGPGSHLAHVAALAAVRLGGAEFLIAADAAEHGVSSLRLRADGGLEAVSMTGAAEGLGVNAPTALAAVGMGGAQFVLLAAAGSSSLSVLRLAETGALVPVDHVIDTRDTRFARVQALETVQVGERVFLLAGGGDDGLSLFTLLPGGRLLHLESLADAPGTGLADIAAIAAAGLGDTLQILVASQSVPGLAQLTLPLAGLGQVLTGGAGAATLAGGAGEDLLAAGAGGGLLSGGAGDDILAAGAGDDRLAGGAGADIFVLGPGGQDVVLDFAPGIDRLDLSAFALLRDPGQLGIVTTATGARIAFAGSEIEIRAAAGGGLERADLFPAGGFGGPDRLPVPPPAEAPGLRREGGAGGDTILGGGGDDTLLGRGGNDRIEGGGGDDRIEGGAGFDTILAGAGNDTVLGGNGRDRVFLGDGDDLFTDNGQGGGLGRDTVFGGAGGDTIEGGNGDDDFFGVAGNDLIFGRLGNDRLFGGDSFDTLHGGDGDDTVDAGQGRDRVFLGNGADLFIDNAQGGGLGRDTVFGGTGDDTIRAGGGDDLFAGGAGADVFVFAAGMASDRITDFVTGEDRLELGPALLGGAANGAQVVAAFASLTAEGVLLDFGGGDSLLLAGLATTAGLADDIAIA